MSEGGTKHDQGKSDVSMVSWELMDLLGRVRMFGEKKYARDNWKKGFQVTRSCAAALRHIFQFLSGETNDPESGLLHLGHAVAMLEHAIYDMKHHPENDNRYRPENTATIDPSKVSPIPTGYVPPADLTGVGNATMSYAFVDKCGLKSCPCNE